MEPKGADEEQNDPAKGKPPRLEWCHLAWKENHVEPGNLKREQSREKSQGIVNRVPGHTEPE